MDGKQSPPKSLSLPEKDVITGGEKANTARYLGAWPQSNNKMTTDITKHIQAMRTGYFAFYGIWSSKRIPFPLKKLFFTALVTSAAISGLEPFALTSQDLERLETAHVLLIRRLFGREGWGSSKSDKQHRSISNDAIRKGAQMPTLDSLIRQRRLTWIQSMLKKPYHHEQYFASMFGSFVWEKQKDLTEEGVTGIPTKEANPALKQLYNDLREAIPEFIGFRPADNPNWQNMVLAEENRFAHVLTYKDKPGSGYKPHPDVSLPPVAEEGFVIDTVGFEDFPCPTCGKKFLTKHEVVAHRISAHKYRIAETVLEGNKCPRCLRSFANKTTCVTHIRSNAGREECRKRGGPGTTKSLQDVPEEQ